jgi:hypothetical protein
MKLAYINSRDSRCFSRKDGLNLAYLAPALILYGIPVLAVAAFLMF